jgi:ATP-dependent Clp protease ATP-binding subunit ClpA
VAHRGSKGALAVWQNAFDMAEIEGLRMTARLERNLAAAAEIARQKGHDYVGTEHALLGLLSDPHSIATQVLRELGADQTARQRLLQVMASPGYKRSSAPPTSEP